MAEHKPDLIVDPVHRAAEMYRQQLTYIREQLVQPRQPQRQMRLGDMPAQDVIDEVVQAVEEV